MTDPKKVDLYFQGKIYRIVWGIAGALFFGGGLFILIEGVVGLAIRIGIGVVLMVLGLEAIRASFLAKISWIAKIFPFIYI